MAEITLRLRKNPKTGQQELTVDYGSESDALPHEHERDHRAIVEGVIGQKLSEGTGLRIERVAPGQAQTTEAQPAPAQRTPIKQGT